MPNRVTTRSSSEAAYYSSSTTTRTKFVVATPGWRELVILPSSGEEDGSHLLEDTSDEAYERRHRLIELKERYNLLVYEFNRSIRASKKKKLSKDVSEELRPAADNMSAKELEEAISRLSASKAPSETTSRPSRLKRKARRIRFTSDSGSSSSSFSSSSFSVLSDASRTSLASTSAKSSPSPPTYRSSYATVAVVRLDDCLCSADSVDISDTTTIAKSRSLMITRGQARQIQELNIAKLCSCDFTLESLESIAEDVSGPKSKRAKIDHHPSTSTTATTSSSSPSKLQSQLKQIENIEKTAIELSLTQNKMLRTTKQDMNKSQSLDDLMATTPSYSHFYRRIN